MPLPFQREFGKVPVMGKWYSRIGKTYDILSMPCSPDPLIIVAAAFLHTPQAIVSVFGPDCLDATFARVQKGVRPHRRVDFPARGLLGALPGPPRGTFGWHLFRGAEFAQTIGFYFLIADMATTFVYNWTSTVYQWQGCKTPENNFAYGAILNHQNLLPAASDSVIFTGWTQTEQRGAYAITGTGPTGPMATASIAWWMNGEYDPSSGIPPCNWRAHLIDLTSGEVAMSTRWMDGSPDHSGDSQFNWNPYATFQHNALVTFIEKSYGVMTITSGFIQVTGTPPKANFDMGGCKPKGKPLELDLPF